jgi:hypothetical protein
MEPNVNVEQLAASEVIFPRESRADAIDVNRSISSSAARALADVKRDRNGDTHLRLILSRAEYR